VGCLITVKESTMIAKARIIPLSPVDWGEGVTKEATLLELTTNAGVTGLGSAYAGPSELLEALEAYHQNPDLLNRVQDSRITPNSAIDIALWDIQGKIAQKPISDLLGTRQHDRILAYATLELHITKAQKADVFEQRIRALKDLGFQAIKLSIDTYGYRDSSKSGREWDAYETGFLTQAREIVGPNVTLMLDVFGSDPEWPNSYNWALRTAKKLEELDFLWFEEPLAPSAEEDFTKLTKATKIAVAGGENFILLKDFEKLATGKSLNIIQPDCTRMGGLTPIHAIKMLANRNNIDLIPHGWNTAVGLAADLQLMSTTPKDRLCMVEFMPTWHLMEPLLNDPFALDHDGKIQVPKGPGLGVELNNDMIENQLGVFKCDAEVLEVLF
jgi:D-galactarolactone cycloisomerase